MLCSDVQLCQSFHKDNAHFREISQEAIGESQLQPYPESFHAPELPLHLCYTMKIKEVRVQLVDLVTGKSATGRRELHAQKQLILERKAEPNAEEVETEYRTRE